MRSFFTLAMLASSVFAAPALTLTDLEKGAAKTLNNPNTFTGPTLLFEGKELTSGGTTSMDEDATQTFNYGQLFVNVPSEALKNANTVSVATIVDAPYTQSVDIVFAVWGNVGPGGDWDL